MAFPSIIQKLIALGNRIQDVNINATFARNTANDARADVDEVLRKLAEFENWVVADTLREHLEDHDISIAIYRDEIENLQARVAALESGSIYVVPEGEELEDVLDNGEGDSSSSGEGEGDSSSSSEGEGDSGSSGEDEDNQTLP